MYFDDLPEEDRFDPSLKTAVDAIEITSGLARTTDLHLVRASQLGTEEQIIATVIAATLGMTRPNAPLTLHRLVVRVEDGQLVLPTAEHTFIDGTTETQIRSEDDGWLEYLEDTLFMVRLVTEETDALALARLAGEAIRRLGEIIDATLDGLGIIQWLVVAGPAAKLADGDF